ISSHELTQLNKRFGAGLSEIGAWLGATDLDGVRLTQGSAVSTSKTTAAVPRDSAVSITGPVHEGSPDSLSPAFAGDVRFDITIKRSTDSQTISSNLDDMGARPRTLTAVLGHINGKLEAAGVETRIGRELIKPEPRTVTAGGKTITLSPGPDQFALAVRGTSLEKISFSAPETADAVYVVQAAGTAGG